jgi:hypothetical protein
MGQDLPGRYHAYHFVGEPHDRVIEQRGWRSRHEGTIHADADHRHKLIARLGLREAPFDDRLPDLNGDLANPCARIDHRQLLNCCGAALMMGTAAA